MKKIKGSKLVLIALIIIIIILSVGYFLYIKTQSNSNKKIDNNSNEIIEENENYLYELTIYRNETSLCITNDNCNEIAYKIPTKTKDAKVLAFDNNNKFILYSDDILYLYNTKTFQTISLDLEKTYKEYIIYPNVSNEEVIGITYKIDDKNIGFYNLNINKKMYENKYLNIEVISKDYLTAYDDEIVYLLDTNQEKIYYKYKFSDDNKYNFITYEYQNQNYFLLNSCNEECKVIKILSHNKEVIIDKEISNNNFSFNNEYLFVNDNNQVYKYDFSGNLKSTSRNYQQVLGLIKDNVIFIEDNNLIIVNLNTNIKKVITEWNENYIYNTSKSNYYTEDILNNSDLLNKKEGIHIILDYKKTDSLNNNGVEYYINDDIEINYIN